MAETTVNITEVNEIVIVNVTENIGIGVPQTAPQVPMTPAETIWEEDVQAALENVSYDYWKRLRNFVSKINDSPTTSQIIIRAIGTSIAYGTNSMTNYIGYGIAQMLGLSNSEYRTPVTNPFNWEVENYSGPYSVRIKGTDGDGNATYYNDLTGQSFKGSELVLYFDTEPDGGTMSVEIDKGNGWEVLESIDCNGTTSYGNVAAYSIDPNISFNFRVSPNADGFSYFSGYFVDTLRPGAIFTNTAWGGSALGHHAGTSVRAGGATPSGDLGLIETFAPSGKVSPDLVIYSGATNDGTTFFAANLQKAVDYSIANGSSVILILEPGSNQTAGGSDWNLKRAAFYTAAASYPENVLVLDWDRYMSPDLSFNPDFHDPNNINDVHPGDYGHGDPHMLAAKYYLGRLGVPMPSPTVRAREIWYGNNDSKNIAYNGLDGVTTSKTVEGAIKEIATLQTNYGPNIIQNGFFNDNSVWVLSAGASNISDGKANVIVEGNFVALQQPMVTNPGDEYYLELDIKGPPGQTATIIDDFGERGALLPQNGTVNFNGGTQKIKITFTANSFSNNLIIKRGASGNYTFTVDNVSVRRKTAKNVIFSGGTTAQRTNAPVKFQSRFNTTTGKPEWWNGTNWVDATGTTV